MKPACSKVTALLLAGGLALLVPAEPSAQGPSFRRNACEVAADADGAADPALLDCVPQSKRVELLRRRVEPTDIAPLDNDYRLHSALHRWKAREAEALAVPDSGENDRLAAYLDGRTIESLRSRALRDAERSIILAEHRILELATDLKAATRAATTWIRRQPGRGLPAAYRRRIIDAADAILAQALLLRARGEERDDLNQVFDRQLHRVSALQG